MIRARGGRLREIPLYDTVPAEPDPGRLAEIERGVDAVTFTSPSSVRNFMRLTAPLNRESLAGAAIACIGPVTARQAEALGLDVAVIPTRFTIEGLVAALDQYYER